MFQIDIRKASFGMLPRDAVSRAFPEKSRAFPDFSDRLPLLFAFLAATSSPTRLGLLPNDSAPLKIGGPRIGGLSMV